MVSQQLLADLRNAKTARRSADDEASQLRQQVLDLHAAGATTEPGPLAYMVTEQSQRRLSYEIVADAVGQKLADRIRDQVTPSVALHLRLKTRSKGTSHEFDEDEEFSE
jgi:hypothetical protein